MKEELFQFFYHKLTPVLVAPTFSLVPHWLPPLQVCASISFLPITWYLCTFSSPQLTCCLCLLDAPSVTVSDRDGVGPGDSDCLSSPPLFSESDILCGNGEACLTLEEFGLILLELLPQSSESFL